MDNIKVKIETSKGSVVVELNSNQAPITVKNFLEYVDSGFYDQTIFHRIIEGFMIQGGGFTVNGSEKPTKSPIKLESKNGLKNDLGTIAMARTNSPNSATAQFFINVANNDFLNNTPTNDGYAVFGKVVDGLPLVLELSKVPTTTKGMFEDWPVNPIVINKISRV